MYRLPAAVQAALSPRPVSLVEQIRVVGLGLAALELVPPFVRESLLIVA